MTAETTGYDAELATIHASVDGLGLLVAIWRCREQAAIPAARSRSAASDAIAATDTAMAGLHAVRARLIAETRASDDAAMERSATLLDDRPG